MDSARKATNVAAVAVEIVPSLCRVIKRSDAIYIKQSNVGFLLPWMKFHSICIFCGRRAGSFCYVLSRAASLPLRDCVASIDVQFQPTAANRSDMAEWTTSDGKPVPKIQPTCGQSRNDHNPVNPPNCRGLVRGGWGSCPLPTSSTVCNTRFLPRVQDTFL